ncbi:BREX-2 system phosphatase PglZ [Actinospica robiniae]|uniref:BREX-2 system phosphatase PglZ n=1 Tax=Actinospica robiniae TaxID=304901 RepID=UPI0004219172|nr:BREX-2 system phosphatase PglZ [Actinospica robiniae]
MPTAAEQTSQRAPRISRSVLAGLVRGELERKRAQLLLVHADSSEWSGTDGSFALNVIGLRYQVSVVECGSVLAAADAWERHQAAQTGSDVRVLVITTSVPDEDLGLSLRAYAAHQATITVRRDELVLEQFNLRELDWRLSREQWLLDALLDAAPPGGWAAGRKRIGTVLTRDAAAAALLEARTGLAGEDDGLTAPDIGTLLEWSAQGAGSQRYAELSGAERDGLAAWMRETSGAPAALVLRLAELGRGADAVPLGLLWRSANGHGDALLLIGALFGHGGPTTGDLDALATAAEGAVARWITAAARSSAATATGQRDRVLAAVARAEQLASASRHLTAGFRESAVLPLGFSARWNEFAQALAHESGSSAAAAVAEKYDALCRHRLAALFPQRIELAEMALRVVRWLARTAEATAAQPKSVAAHLSRHIDELAWVDRALNTLHHGDPYLDPDQDSADYVASVLRELHDRARTARSAMDTAFAEILARWTPAADAAHPGGVLPIEAVMETVVAPLAAGIDRAPMILVIDGMSGAVAVELAEEMTRRNQWTEIALTGQGRKSRMTACAMVPSITVVSRCSLLSGTASKGGQEREKAGFAAFWRAHGYAASLFHKADIPGEGAGARLSGRLTQELSGPGVVGVVLNDVDDALDKGARGDRARWAHESLTHLAVLLDAASAYGRPVVIVSDHGHVLDRSTAQDSPARTTSTDRSQRYRSTDGEPAGPGEVVLTGLRVLEHGGSLVAAVSEPLRYTSRKAGYHGGASLAEMAIPVLVFLQAGQPVPEATGGPEWSVLNQSQTTPVWWSGEQPPGGVVQAQPAPRKRPARGAVPSSETGAEALFSLEPGQGTTANAAPTRPASPLLGSLVVASEAYARQRKFVPKMKDAEVTAVIDALDAAGRTLPAAALAQAVGRSGTLFDGFVANLERLLNIDQYPVVSRIDAGRTIRLDTELLREQFGLGRR